MTVTPAHRDRPVTSTDLRARFSARLSRLYASEVPLYGTLLEVTREVNERVLRSRGADAERLGSIARVSGERHGAIRVGTPEEMAQVARIFGALGMHACGFYDLRDARPQPVPVVSTAFRPLDRDELATNPFRVFTSMLVPEDRRFFDADLESRLKRFLAARRLFPDELLDLADRARALGELSPDDGERFLDLATASFALSTEPVDRSWYEELERISGVAADIGGVATTHINHLTPRVLDIDDLYRSMQDRGVDMIDEIQGPPRWDGPDVLLRQTSFRALSEPRTFREPNGSLGRGSLRVRFGEVEARGIALTPAGLDLYDRLLGEVDVRLARRPDRGRQDVAAEVWAEQMPPTEDELRRRDLAFFTYAWSDDVVDRRARGQGRAAPQSAELGALLDTGAVVAEPIVYEDFLPRSAAGIFASNLDEGDTRRLDEDQGGADRDVDWMSGVLGGTVSLPADVYRREADASLAAVGRRLGRPVVL